VSIPDVFRRITSALDEAGIAYMLTGSFASAHHGTARSTQDIDIVIETTEEQLRTFIQSLRTDEYYSDLDTALEAHRRESLFNLIDLQTGWKIDLIFRKARAFSKEEFHRRQLVDIQGIAVFVASAEDVVIAKLEWAKLAKSQRQIEDVVAILKIKGEALDQSYVEKWISELGLQPQWSIAKRARAVPESDG
jgi:predicted nucleotidyltransferase